MLGVTRPKTRPLDVSANREGGRLFLPLDSQRKRKPEQTGQGEAAPRPTTTLLHTSSPPPSSFSNLGGGERGTAAEIAAGDLRSKGAGHPCGRSLDWPPVFDLLLGYRRIRQ